MPVGCFAEVHFGQWGHQRRVPTADLTVMFSRAIGMDVRTTRLGRRRRRRLVQHRPSLVRYQRCDVAPAAVPDWMIYPTGEGAECTRAPGPCAPRDGNPVRGMAYGLLISLFLWAGLALTICKVLIG